MNNDHNICVQGCAASGGEGIAHMFMFYLLMYVLVSYKHIILLSLLFYEIHMKNMGKG